MFELVCIWLVESKGKKWSLVYSLTEYGKRIDTDRIHLWVTLVIRDNKECDVCKKASPDKIRKYSENTNVKSENKVLNTVIEKEAPQIKWFTFLERLNFLFTNKL